jgi:hypothetical protein
MPAPCPASAIGTYCPRLEAVDAIDEIPHARSLSRPGQSAYAAGAAVLCAAKIER